MNAVTLLKSALKSSEELTFPLIEDMRDAPLTRPTPNGGNHPHWILGHLAVSEEGIHSVMTGEDHALKHWHKLFGRESEPSDDAAGYPDFDELIAAYRQARAKNLALLETLSDDDLDTPSKAIPPGMESVFGTLGQCFHALAMHWMMHRGQLADARRAAGKDRLIM